MIIDYGMGNIFSLQKVIEKMGSRCQVSNRADTVLNAQRIILPGVGHFGRAMSNLASHGLVDVLNEAVLNKGIPILGVCLGMQLMARSSEEGDSSGLNWFDASVTRFRVANPSLFKVPHVGWNMLDYKKPSRLLRGVEGADEFYFLHSYHFQPIQHSDVVGTTRYDYSFASVIERDNIYGVQFHPEKSHFAGRKIFKNFLRG